MDRPATGETTAPRPATGAVWLFSALSAYCAATWLDANVFALGVHNLTPLRLGAGVAMVVCLRSGWQSMPLIAVLSLAVALLSGPARHAALPLSCVLSAAVSDALAGGMAAMLLQRVFAAPPASVPDLFRAVGRVCLPAAVSGAGVIVLQQATEGYVPWDQAEYLFATLVMAVCLGLLLVYPLYRACAAYRHLTGRECRWLGGVLGGNLVFLLLSFNGYGGCIYFIMPLLVLLAYNARLHGLMLALAPSMMAVAYGATMGFGPFQMPTTGEAAFLLATFLCSTTIVTLGVALHNRQLLNADSNREMWEQKAMRDPLTGLFNRSRLDCALEAELRRAQRSEDVLSLLMVDVDNFKSYNDIHGHLAGDTCLRAVAHTLRTVVHRAPDMVARYGGEEFACVLPGTAEAGAAQMAERIRCAVAELCIVHPGNTPAGHVTVSVGVTTVRGGRNATPDQAIDMADRALYRAKSKGRNTVATAQDILPPQACPHADLLRLAWSRSYECGEARIDAQHRQLFEMVNRLLAAFLDNAPRAACLAIIHELLTALAEHFRDEEAVLRSRGYPDAEHHAELHATLLEAAGDLAARYEHANLPLDTALRVISHEVVARHMLDDDTKFHPYVQGTSGQRSAGRHLS
ncbi:diguanylate cyclase [Nitratidesulfovibrio sp. SRB-5]|uniref:diguanylate cyclase n=1 Tax=Nitratidesulfovibrio sp. SRB-5 TaxID=2872636 RepID=UPI0010255D26|nr:diguanylate cyclase [Nitratidesulfovibrio sp. SRB-5]MBZ2170935.1 diguanylate cyclase [Nitratidesulfovibrio sp. SRB-5]RXF77878.1 diguanylate cyclase [Desulfovibrio sp. DS-1]